MPFNPITDLQQPEDNDESLRQMSDEELNSIRTGLVQTRFKVFSIVSVLRKNNNVLKKDLETITTLRRRLRRVIPVIPGLVGAAGFIAGEGLDDTSGGFGLPIFGGPGGGPKKPKTPINVRVKVKEKDQIRELEMDKVYTVIKKQIIQLVKEGKLDAARELAKEHGLEAEFESLLEIQEEGSIIKIRPGIETPQYQPNEQELRLLELERIRNEALEIPEGLTSEAELELIAAKLIDMYKNQPSYSGFERSFLGSFLGLHGPPSSYAHMTVDGYTILVNPSEADRQLYQSSYIFDPNYSKSRKLLDNKDNLKPNILVLTPAQTKAIWESPEANFVKTMNLVQNVMDVLGPLAAVLSQSKMQGQGFQFGREFVNKRFTSTFKGVKITALKNYKFRGRKPQVDLNKIVNIPKRFRQKPVEVKGIIPWSKMGPQVRDVYIQNKILRANAPLLKALRSSEGISINPMKPIKEQIKNYPKSKRAELTKLYNKALQQSKTMDAKAKNRIFTRVLEDIRADLNSGKISPENFESQVNALFLKIYGTEIQSLTPGRKIIKKLGPGEVKNESGIFENIEKPFNKSSLDGGMLNSGTNTIAFVIVDKDTKIPNLV